MSHPYLYERYSSSGRKEESFWRDSETHMACAKPAEVVKPEPPRICAHCEKPNNSRGYGEYCSRSCTDMGLQLLYIRANYNPNGRTHEERNGEVLRALTRYGDGIVARAIREQRGG
jgi:hypothetical protein